VFTGGEQRFGREFMRDGVLAPCLYGSLRKTSLPLQLHSGLNGSLYVELAAALHPMCQKRRGGVALP